MTRGDDKTGCADCNTDSSKLTYTFKAYAVFRCAPVERQNKSGAHLIIIGEINMIETWTDEQIEEYRISNMQEDNTRKAMEAWIEYSED